MNILELETPRLRLRKWQEEDSAVFYALNSDPDVMRYFPAILDEQQSQQFLETIITKFSQQGGWGLWAAELKETSAFIGFLGLNIPAANLPFSPALKLVGVCFLIIGIKALLLKGRKPLFGWRLPS